MYISPVDILGISLDDVLKLDEKGLIRLEKQLKIKKLQQKETGFNPDLLDNLLEQLKDESKKKFIYFIEKNPAFKAFLATGETDEIGAFSFYIPLPENINTFLAPYMDAYFMRLVKRECKVKDYSMINKAMENKALFTDDLLGSYYSYVNNQLDVLIERIKATKKGALIATCPEITYKSFIGILNTVPTGIIESSKINYVNALIDYFKKISHEHREFIKIKKAFTNLLGLDISREEVKKSIQNLVLQINVLKPNYDSNSASNHQKSKTRSRSTYSEPESSISGRAVWTVIMVIVAAVRLAMLFGGSSRSSSSNYNTPYSYDYASQKEYVNRVTKARRAKELLYSDLINASNNSNLNGRSVAIKAEDKPLTNTVNWQKFELNDNTLRIKNNKNNPLIVLLNRNNTIDRENYSVYIEPNSSLKIYGFVPGVAITFYSGDSLINNNGKRFFKHVSKQSREWLKQKYILQSIDTAGTTVTIDEKEIKFNVPTKIELHEVEEVVEEVEETRIESSESAVIAPTEKPEVKDLKTLTSGEKNNFFKLLNTRGTEEHVATRIFNGRNPFPRVFKHASEVGRVGTKVGIKNLSEKDVMLFTWKQGSKRNQSILITKETYSDIYLEKGERIYFYVGTELVQLTHKIDRKEPHIFFAKRDDEDVKKFKYSYLIKSFGEAPAIAITNKAIGFKALTTSKYLISIN